MNWKLYTHVGILGCLIGGLVFQAHGQSPAPADDEDTEFNREYRYVEKLQFEFGMPDLAEIVLEQMKKRFTKPRYVARLEARAINGLVSLGKFDEAQKLVDAQEDKDSFATWQMRLVMANAFFQFNRYDEFLKIYQDFFKAFPKAPEGEEGTYLNISYSYAQLLARQRRFGMESVAAFRHLLSQKMSDAEARMIRTEMITQMIKVASEMEDANAKKALLAEADRENDKQFWVPDARFGQAIVAKAHIMSLMGNIEGAQNMIDEYMPQLRQIHDRLLEYYKQTGDASVLRDSPMPQCRFLLASILWDEVQKIAASETPAPEDRERMLTLLLGARGANNQRRANGAFNHFINVFVNYPESQWAMDAGEASEKISAFILERFNTEIKTPFSPEIADRIRRDQFGYARSVFNEHEYTKAVLLLEAFLTRFPDTSEALQAHSLLVQSYLQLSLEEENDKERELLDVYVDMVAANLAERFVGMPEELKVAAAGSLRMLADMMPNLGFAQKREAFYALFFKNHPDDPAAAPTLLRFADEAFKTGEIVAAQKYYGMLERYTEFTAYPEVLLRLAEIAKVQGSSTNQIAYIEKAIAAYQDPARKTRRNEATYVNALLQRASETRALALVNFQTADDRTDINKQLALAARYFQEAAKEAGDALKSMPNDPTLTDLHALASFFFISTFEFISQEPDKTEAFRKQLIGLYEKFVKDFPQSRFAPRALVQIGTLHTLLNDTQAAESVFARLQRDYPESDEARNSVPRLAKALMDLGYTAEAIDQYKKMFANPGNFTPSQYFDAGQALLDARDFTLALEAFELAGQGKNNDIPLQMEILLGRAKALFGLKRLEEARAALIEFEKNFSGYERILDAWFLLVEVHSLIGEGEKDNAKRNTSFNAGVQTLRKIAAYLKTQEGIARTDLAAAMLSVRRMKAEKGLGLADHARRSGNSAAQGFLGLMKLPPGNEKTAPFLHDAYLHGITLFIELDTPDLAVEYATQYLTTFPEGKHAQAINLLLNQANAILSAQR